MTNSSANAVIRVEDVWKVYQMGDIEVQALRGVSFQINSGEFIAIMGPSGSGKSTLMNLIGCLDQPSRGSYWLAGTNVSTLNDDQLAEIRNKRIGFVFQQFNLLKRTSALENVELPLIYSGSKRRRERAMEALRAVGLGDRVHHKPNELSGGEQQRVAVARALINKPAVIFADEPSGNLDTASAENLHQLFFKLTDEFNQTFVIVTHNEQLANMADRKLVMVDGKISNNE